MKSEILKKTLFYRVIAISLGLLLPYLITQQLAISLMVGLVTETVSLITYYIYEYSWRRYVERKNLKEGVSLLQINGDPKVRIAYEVIEDLGDGKLIIEVI